jgi:hypothetical protein
MTLGRFRCNLSKSEANIHLIKTRPVPPRALLCKEITYTLRQRKNKNTLRRLVLEDNIRIAIEWGFC